MHKPEPVLEYVMQKILWDLENQTDQQIPTRRPEFVSTNEKIEFGIERILLLQHSRVRKWKKSKI